MVRIKSPSADHAHENGESVLLRWTWKYQAARVPSEERDMQNASKCPKGREKCGRLGKGSYGKRSKAAWKRKGKPGSLREFRRNYREAIAA
jgi:hypothetical protein